MKRANASKLELDQMIATKALELVQKELLKKDKFRIESAVVSPSKYRMEGFLFSES